MRVSRYSRCKFAARQQRNNKERLSMSQMIPGFVTLLALAFYFYTTTLVANGRRKHGIAAPAMTGNPEFERAVRVQMNTLEWLPIFLPVLWLFSTYVDAAIGGVLGLVWVIGRVMFAQGYMAAADKRGTGFAVQLFATGVLFLGTLIGMIWVMLGMQPLLSAPLM
jgi:glutathione S-transferase